MITVEHLLSGSVCAYVQLTVAWERGKVKGKEKGQGNDLALPAHENQMFSRTPRNPICTSTQRNYSICIPYSSETSCVLISARMNHGKTPVAQLEAVGATPM